MASREAREREEERAGLMRELLEVRDADRSGTATVHQLRRVVAAAWLVVDRFPACVRLEQKHRDRAERLPKRQEPLPLDLVPAVPPCSRCGRPKGKRYEVGGRSGLCASCADLLEREPDPTPPGVPVP
jgi:hypothetical protein